MYRTKLHDILDEIDLKNPLYPWKSHEEQIWVQQSWRYLVESYPAEYDMEYCESAIVFFTLISIYISFTKLAWDSIDLLYLEDLADEHDDLSYLRIGLLASEHAPDDIQFLLSMDNDRLLYNCLQSIIESFRPEVVNALKKKYGGEEFLYLSFRKIMMDENCEDIPPDFENSVINNWKSFTTRIGSLGDDLGTYINNHPEFSENIIARWIMEDCPILWERLSY